MTQQSSLFDLDTEAPVKVFQVLGTTDEVTTCDCCGREDLKGTIVLKYMTEEDAGKVVYFGSTCGARAAGWTTKELHAKAKDAQREFERQVRMARWSHPAYIERQASMKSHYDNGGTFDTAPFEEWRRLEAEERSAIAAQFGLSEHMTRRIL